MDYNRRWRRRAAPSAFRYGTYSQNESDGNKNRAYGDPIEIRIGGYELTIRKEEAVKIEVEMEEFV